MYFDKILLFIPKILHPWFLEKWLLTRLWEKTSYFTMKFPEIIDAVYIYSRVTGSIIRCN